MTKSSNLFAVVLLACVVLASACADERRGKSKGTEIVATSDTSMSDGGHETMRAGSGSDREVSDAQTSMSNIQEACRPVQSPEAIPNRKEAFTFDGANSERAVFTRDLFSLFKTHCGACHVDTNLGDFKIREAATFSDDSADWQEKMLASITSEDPEEFMPPPDVGGVAFSERAEGDPIRELNSLLEQWIAAEAPIDLFYVPTAEVTDPGYRLSEPAAMSMTNLGNCVPYKNIVGNDSAKMDQLDKTFADMKQLPPQLSQTDLISFDAESLAKQRVLSFAPTYPLFSDSAKKMRHVRVPKGQTLAFDKDTQQFTLPPNTRLYKTFFKHIYDSDGNERYKKIETRIIVSRPDGPDGPNGEHDTHSLFGTYTWNETETEAFLVTDPLRDGKPFRDRLITYVTDEKKAQEILDAAPLNKVVALQEGGAVRSYAIPGADRCIQCHMGAPNRSFVLGLTPMELRSRPKGQGGVIEDIGDDEMNQLQRFLDYGLISGLKDMNDVLSLEDSQGDRKARNKYELAAQGYMLGNCAGCHNPRGFPTTQNPELKPLLNFYPSKDGGIFQFPLDRVSPRIRRGIGQDISIPYISPSLIDYTPNNGEHYVQKWVTDGKDDASAVYMAAPWRSLIYRNVDSPFPYSEDFALFPHMPMNAPGFDCRAPRIFGDWMVSIPAKRIVPKDAPLDKNMKPILPVEGSVQVQPYVEVVPQNSDYMQAQDDAEARLKTYHGQFTQQPVDEFTFSGLNAKGQPLYTAYLAGFRSTMYCPDTSDIVDSEVHGDVLVPQDGTGSHTASSLPSLQRQFDALTQDPKDFISAVVKFAGQPDGVPDSPHWVVTDITDSPGDWYPRRTDWDKVLVTHDSDLPLDPSQERAVKLLQDRKLSEDFRKRVLEKHAYTTWVEKPECNLSAVRTVDSYKGAERLRWMDRAYLDRPAPAGSSRVYEQSWGEAVYNQICVNCHGPNYDSRGRQADTLMIMTGGDTRVANFKSGLFGPASSPHANVERIFQPFATADVTADDWAARYVAWMGLGGTQRVIPPVIMNVVATLAVFGEKRPGNLDLTGSGANMLSIARTLCQHSLGLRPTRQTGFDVNTGVLATREVSDSSEIGVALLDINADYEMWLDLCSYNNPPPVRVVGFRDRSWEEWDKSKKPVTFNIYGGSVEEPASWYWPDRYPKDQRIGDERGDLQMGIQPGNRFPWCALKPPPANAITGAKEALIANDWIGKARNSKPMPYCPSDFLVNDANRMKAPDLEDWATRGAVNAGFAVYLYLEQLAKIGKAQPAFDRCEQLPK